jgi:hypothetical protein
VHTLSSPSKGPIGPDGTKTLNFVKDRSLIITGYFSKYKYSREERQMKNQKKNLSKKLRVEEEEKEKIFEDLSEKVSSGSTKDLIRLLANSGRGYDMEDDDLENFLKDFQ